MPSISLEEQLLEDLDLLVEFSEAHAIESYIIVANVKKADDSYYIASSISNPSRFLKICEKIEEAFDESIKRQKLH